LSNRNESKTAASRQADLDNRSRQLNPQDTVYWSSRGQPQAEQPNGTVGADGPLGAND
jgi:hypothetical protein